MPRNILAKCEVETPANAFEQVFIQLGASGIVMPVEQKKLKGIIHSDPEIMGGTPVFQGTRVPLQNLIDSLEGDQSIEEFLTAFPTVQREQVIAVIEAGKR